MKKIQSIIFTLYLSKYKYVKFVLILICTLCSIKTNAQIKEPSFIGEALLLQLPDSTTQKLDKEFAQYRQGTSWATNAWNATFLKVESGKAKLRLPMGSAPVIIIKATDNESDPMSIISIYRFKAKNSKRETMIYRSNEGTIGSSYNVTKNLIPFRGDRFGEKSYLIVLPNLEPGEYGIVVRNPNSIDEKRTIISCFGIDK